jgi:UDP-hydrolysing UDP-N-acetyl-D-glucosamine 2-epimerase
VNLVCVITARPSWGRIQTALDGLRKRNAHVQVWCPASATIPRFGDIAAQVRADGYPVTFQPLTQIDTDSRHGMARTMALTTLDLSTALQHTSPDAVITIADRYETLATAVAAAYAGIPLIHVQGGELSGNLDQKVRGAVTQLADYHCVATTMAGYRVRMANPAGRVLITGCPSVDLAARIDPDAPMAIPGVGPEVDPRQSIVVLWHPETGHAHQAETETVLSAVLAVGQPVIWFWPNADAGTETVAKVLRQAHERDVPIRFVRHLPASDFLGLLTQCQVLVGNSSVGIREASYLGVRTVNIGTRQVDRDRAENVVDVPVVSERITQAIQDWLGRPRPDRSVLYGDGHAGERIAEGILGWLSRPLMRHAAVTASATPVPMI